MTVFTDHKRTANLELRNWDGDNWSPDWSRDFWNVGELENLNDDSDVFPEDGLYAALLEKHDISASEPVYGVEDIDYLIDYANDMINGEGDYADNPSSNTSLFVAELD